MRSTLTLLLVSLVSTIALANPLPQKSSAPPARAELPADVQKCDNDYGACITLASTGAGMAVKPNDCVDSFYACQLAAKASGTMA